MTLACFTSLPSFAQSLPPITVHPGPVIDWMPMPLGPENPPQTGDCNDFFGCGNGTGGGDQSAQDDDDSDPDQDDDARACLDLYAMRDEECLFDPVGKNEYNWNPFGTTFMDLFNTYVPGNFSGLPSGGFPDFGAPLQVYQNIIRDVAQAYWDDQSLDAVNIAYWNAIDVFCFGFPEETIYQADRSDCYDAAYSVSLRLIPSFSDNAFTIDQIEQYGVTIQHQTSTNPFANWAAGFFSDINKVKECKIWFDAKDQIPGCE